MSAGDVTRRRIVHRAAGHLLGYPDVEMLAQLPTFGAAVTNLPNDVARRGLTKAIDDFSARDLGELQRSYVTVFDLSRKHALYLSYWTDGDTRRRGEVLTTIKQRYRASGFLVDTHGELPDFLPLVLEYAAIADPDDGLDLLSAYRPSIELLKFALLDSAPVYAGVVSAVCETLPGASPADAAAVHRMAASGPPSETVGLEPYTGQPLLPFVEARS